MTKEERILRLLTIQPTDLSIWMKLCRRLNTQVATAHPNYPRLQDMQVMSYVKRLLPEIRAMIAVFEKDPEKPDSV